MMAVGFNNAFCFPVLLGASIKDQCSKLYISFDYTNQSTHGSNQFAIWIEDINGKYIKTLFVTDFTGKGGFIKRETSLPKWVAASKIAKKDLKSLDGSVGATPKTPNLIYTWDCTDENKNKVPSGKYKVFVEGTTKDDNEIIFSGEFEISDNNTNNTTDINFNTEYIGNSQNSNMLTNIKGKFVKE
jgi:hypothetical protein